MIRLVIVGGGALGCLFAARLSPFADVLLLVRSEDQAQALEQSGIRLEWADGAVTVPVRATASAGGTAPAHAALVLTKAYDTAAACAAVEPLVGERTAVVTLQNGLGNDAVIAGHFGEARLVRGVTTEAATLLSPCRVRHAARGVTTLECGGVLDDGVALVADLFRSGGFETELTPDARPAIWRKLAANAAINGPTALLGVQNGWIARSDAAARLATALVAEVVAVARCEGVELAAGLAEAAIAVAEATAENVSSMLQDVRAGRRTEADAIYGELGRRARAAGIAAPSCETLALLLRAWEESHLPAAKP